MTQVLSPVTQPPFEIYELLTVGQGVLQVRAVDDTAAGGINPLTRAFFVDPQTTTPLADQTGAAETPFSTVQAAIDALPTPSGGSILLASAQYAAEALVVTGKPVTLIGLVGEQTVPATAAAVVDLTACSLLSDSAVGLCNLQIGAIDNFSETPSNVTIEGCNTGAITCQDLIARFSRLDGLTAGGDVTLTYTNIANTCTVAGSIACSGQPGAQSLPAGTTCDTAVSAFGYDLTGLTAFRLDARQCHIGGTTTLVDTSSLEQCSFGNAPSLSSPGTIGVDTFSLENFLTRSGTLAGGATLTRSDVTPAQKSLNLSGAAPFTHTLLPAGHPPGVYNWSAYVSKEVGATTGTLTLTISYTDPDTGAATEARAALTLVGTGHFALNPISIVSSGATAITVDGVFAAITGGPPRLNVYDAVQAVG